MYQDNPAAALEALKKAQAIPLNDPILAQLGLAGLEKATFSQGTSATSGLTFYDLELGAKSLYPVLTPLRNLIPRVPGRGGIQAAWRAITGINVSGMRIGVSGGNRGGVQIVSTADYTASYKGIGIESNVDFEAQYAAAGFDDVRAIAARTGLQSLMLGEEAMILGGNTSLALGTTPTPTLSASSAGGSLANGTLSVICVALSLDGVINGSLAGGIQSTITRTNADGSTDIFGGGAAQRSAAATVSVTGPTGSVAASVAALSGALGYAWFWGAAGSELLGAITSINSVTITATATGTQTAASLGAADRSTNALAFDGLLTQALKAGSGATIVTMPSGVPGVGTPLTADGAGGVVEIDAVLKTMWDTYRLSPDTIWVNSQEALNLSKKILQGSANSAFKFEFSAAQDVLGGGIMIRKYLNRFSMQGGSVLDIRVHPNMPAGTILFTTAALPYPVNNIGNVMQIRTRQDYYQIEWPLRSRKYEYGVYADEVLQHYFPPSLAILNNIGNG
ncbi:hypothetical protein [Methylobacterium tarhaniae]|uniref:hypothetical protein n=1 Tax=Methylobacterium tarhaniae TaxID=1187852 RepID=UPI00069E16AA|nr:hypothetical protein [Methylobacterium tarhaniae]